MSKGCLGKIWAACRKSLSYISTPDLGLQGGRGSHPEHTGRNNSHDRDAGQEVRFSEDAELVWGVSVRRSLGEYIFPPHSSPAISC